MDAEVTEGLARIAAGARPAEVESETLDCKQEPRTPGEVDKILTDAAICFANARGGHILVGLDDDQSGTAAFVGTALDPPTVQRRIYELTKPALLVAVTTVSHNGTTLLVISVPQSFEIHADTQGRAKRRVGTDCLSLSPPEMAMLREERRGVDWSAVATDRTTDEVAPEVLALARRSLRRVSDDRAPLADLTDEDLLRALGVTDDSARLLRAGEVLFCARPAATPHIVYQYRPTPGGEATAVERLSGPLLLAYERLIELAWARRNVTPLNLPGGEQIELADFPEGAIREALANAVLHREYRLEEPVHVEHSPSAFVVVSPGPLVGGVTPTNILTHPSKPRNRCLFAAARLLRLAEETGRGVDRMYREMIRSGRDVPVIEHTTATTRVALLGGAPRTQIARFTAQLAAPERDDTDTLLVLFTLCRQRTIDAQELAPIIQKTEVEAEAVLQRLSHDDLALLEPTRETRRLQRSQYRLRAEALRSLGSAVRYHRRTVDEIDRKVIAHVKEYDRISNRTLQNLFDIDVYRARDILADLVQREILVRTSDQARGPKVDYGPGAKFPHPRARTRKRKTPPPEGQLPLDP